MKIKKEIVIIDNVYRSSILCFFNLSKKEAIKRLNKYDKNEEFVASINEIKGLGEMFCYNGVKRYMLYLGDFDDTKIDDMSALVHEIRHLTDFLLKDINFSDKVEYIDLEPPAYYQEFLFKQILTKYLEKDN